RADRAPPEPHPPTATRARQRPQPRQLEPGGSPRLRESNAGALFDGANPAQKEPGALELALERRALVRRERNEETASGLRVVPEGDECVVGAVELEVGLGELAIPPVAAGPDPRARGLERPLEGRQPLGFEPDP